jgi:hypothetical protein
MTMYVIGAGVVLVGLQAVLTLSLLRALWRVRDVGTRVAHYGDALSLLTETTESGFRAVAGEVERLGHPRARRPEARTTTARVATAVRRGRSVQEIAADEQVSEGEVRLRLHLAEPAAPAAASDTAAPAVKDEKPSAKMVAGPAPAVSAPPRGSRNGTPSRSPIKSPIIKSQGKSPRKSPAKGPVKSKGKSNGSVRA